LCALSHLVSRNGPCKWRMQVWAQGRTLQVSSVFYALALLQARYLPALQIFTQHVCTAANNMFALIGARTAPYTPLKSRAPVLPWEGSRAVVWHHTRWDWRCRRPCCGFLTRPACTPQLPQLYMATFFTRAVETASELRISLKRLDAFLALPEPPPPSHLSGSGDGPAAPVS